ncbi:transcriptional regulator [Actinoplanes sp. OR16]|uniref:helix-turn-helix transcriptional regulator n=1 Tax=Actinoplanes sp. OR16 TaxID=946334 RepID=UPI000F71D926|nr:LuxR family transcriptional regulator [Actinoplanes sp. OR16]BBH69229.1 transcriptional regulator [Actinoplanes sp. OR16]
MTDRSLIGRERELADVIAVVDAAAQRPASMLIHGDAGIGKSALLAAASSAARRRGHRTVSLRAGVLRPFALAGDLMEVPAGARCGPALVGALLRTLDEMSRDQPVTITADDVHLADAESLRLLAHVATHGSTERFALLLTARGHRLRAGTATGVPRYPLNPLTEDAAARLLDALSRPDRGRPDTAGGLHVPARLRLDVLRRARGNPLALRLFADDAGVLPDEFPDLVRSLPAETRWLLLHAALADDGEQIGTLTAAAGGSRDLRGWAPAERAGLVVVREGLVHFRDPLVRAACVTGRGPHDVVRAHRGLAAATRKTRHLAASRPGPDASVAATLEEAAGEAIDRTDYLAAADALQAAAERSGTPADAARRYARAVYAAYRSGHPGWAIELHERVMTAALDPDAAGVAAGGAAFALIQMAQPWQAFEVAVRALDREPRDGRVVLSLVYAAATAALFSGAPAHRARLPELLERIGRDGGDRPDQPMMPPLDDVVTRAAIQVVADPAGYAGGCPEPAGTGPSGLFRLIAAGSIAFLLDESPRAATELRAVWESSTSFDGPGTTFTPFPFLAIAMIDAGRWSEAAVLLNQAERAAGVRRIPLLKAVIPALRETLRALRHDGRRVPAARHDTMPPAPGGGSLLDGLHQRAAGLIALAGGDHDTAYRYFRRMFDEDGEPRHYLLGPRSLPQLALAAVKSGRESEAAAVLRRCRIAAGPAPGSRMTMLLAHAAGLLGDSEEDFLAAVSEPERELSWPLEYAEAQLNYGLWLRSRRRFRAARPQLLAARDTFLRLGALAHADQAGRGLPAGLRPSDEPAAPAGAFTALTAQKQAIARMAAAGLSNREIAGRLHLSPRTIGSHLYRIYAEIGVGNRHQLRALIDHEG